MRSSIQENLYGHPKLPGSTWDHSGTSPTSCLIGRRRSRRTEPYCSMVSDSVNRAANTLIHQNPCFFSDLRKLPHLSASRKIGDLTKRIKLIKAYALTIADLLDGMPMLCKIFQILNLKQHNKSQAILNKMPRKS